ncbi:unnamed protein product, partial [Sphacelaria rigidula]
LVIPDDLSNFVWLELTEACTSEVTAEYLLQWCKTLRVRRVWIRDNGTHFENQVQESRSRA